MKNFGFLLGLAVAAAFTVFVGAPVNAASGSGVPAKSNPVLLYANLSLKEAKAMSAILTSEGIANEVASEGSLINVDVDKVVAARLLLSSKGLPEPLWL